jgi:hypothetical protein
MDKGQCSGGGPEVPIEPALLPVFRRCFVDLFVGLWDRKFRGGNIVVDDTLFSKCEPNIWLDASRDVSFPHSMSRFVQVISEIVHQNVGFQSAMFMYFANNRLVWH